MKERSIRFGGAMVRALLDGRKTQTRDIVKLPHHNPLGQWEPTTIGGENGGRTAAGKTVPLQGGIWHTRTGDSLMCPHGQPGDHLWVREKHLNWWQRDEANPDGPRVFSHVAAYAADGYELEPGEKWIQSNHMLRAASRITLEITAVRVERLQDISEADAQAEGVPRDTEPCDHARQSCEDIGCMGQTHKSSFCDQWCALNGIPSWNANPWVWVREFTRATP